MGAVAIVTAPIFLVAIIFSLPRSLVVAEAIFLFPVELGIVFCVDVKAGVCDDSENLFRGCTGGKRSA